MLIFCLIIAQNHFTQLNTERTQPWANFLFVNNFLNWDQQFLHWTWSLGVEFQFYLVAPILVYFLGNKPNWIMGLLLILLVASFAFRKMGLISNSMSLYSYQEPLAAQMYFNSLYSATQNRYVGLITGLILAYFFVYKKSQLYAFINAPSNQIVILVISLAFIAISLSQMLRSQISVRYDEWYLITYRGFFSIGATGLIAIMLSQKWLGPYFHIVLGNRYMRALSQLSFSFFLFNMLIIHVVLYFSFDKVTQAFTIPLSTALQAALLITLINSTLIYFSIERPIKKLRKRILSAHE